MAKTYVHPYPQNANNQSVTLTNADTTVAKLCFTAHVTNDSDVKSITATSNQATGIILHLYVTRGGNDYLIGSMTVNGSSGFDSTTPITDLISAAYFGGLPVDNVGKLYLPLKAGDTLKVACDSTMTAGKTCWVNIFGEDY